MKWDMGWMHDTLAYFQEDPIGRRYHHHKLTFRSMYFWSENYVLPLSHDEVVHGKRSLIEKMPGDDWQRFANLRLMYAYMWAQPGKKLLFQGGEIGQFSEWAHDRSVDWHLLGDSPFHVQLMTFVAELNRLYASTRALHIHDVGLSGFEWVERRRQREQRLLVPAQGRLGRVRRRRRAVPVQLHARSRATTTASACPMRRALARAAQQRRGRVRRQRHGQPGRRRWRTTSPCHGRPASLRLTLPPLSAVYLQPDR